MLAYDPEHKRIAYEEKRYLFRFELEGRHVPEVLTTGEVGGGTRKEFAGSLTRRQYERFIRFWLTVLRNDEHDPAHEQYIRQMEARQKREARRKGGVKKKSRAPLGRFAKDLRVSAL